MASPRRVKDYSARQRERETRLISQLERQPSADLLGIVSPGGVFGGRLQGQKEWTLQIPLIAWRRAGEPVRQHELTVRKLASERVISEAQKKLQPYDVFRFRARIAEENDFGSPMALLIRTVGKDRDPELRQLSKELQKPVEAEDPTFGVFRLDRSFGTFEADVDWDGARVTLVLEEESQSLPAQSLMHAKALHRARKGWLKRITDFAAAQLLVHKNETWLIEGEPSLTRGEFVRAMTLSSIYVRPDGGFSFGFDDGDLFAGHTIVVRGSLRDGPTDADIVG